MTVTLWVLGVVFVVGLLVWLDSQRAGSWDFVTPILMVGVVSIALAFALGIRERETDARNDLNLAESELKDARLRLESLQKELETLTKQREKWLEAKGGGCD